MSLNYSSRNKVIVIPNNTNHIPKTNYNNNISYNINNKYYNKKGLTIDNIQYNYYTKKYKENN